MANKYVTATGAGLKDGTSWANAFNWSDAVTDFASASAGDTYYIKGSHTHTSGLTSIATDGSMTGGFISLIGVKSGTTNEPPIAADWAYTTDRPDISISGSNRIEFDNYWQFRNLIVTANMTLSALRMDDYCFIENCKITQAGLGYGLTIAGTNSLAINNEISHSGGARALNIVYPATVMHNYIHDSSIGIRIDTVGAGSRIIGNIIETCDYCIDLYTYGSCIIEGNTIYGGSTAGIYGTTSGLNFIRNNSISGCGTGINFTSGNAQALVDYNNYYNNTTDVSGVSKGANATAVNPQFTDAANGDFSLASDSALIGAGLGITLGVG